MGSALSLQQTRTGPYYPCAADIFELREFFLHYLPLELIDTILDCAEYWPCVHAERALDVVARAKRGRHPHAAPNAEYVYLVTKRIPPEAKVVQKVVYNITSHDQGWGGEERDRGTHGGSWTWFEAANIRAPEDAEPWWVDAAEHRFPVDLDVPDHAEEDAAASLKAEVRSPNPETPDKSRWTITTNLTAVGSYTTHTLTWTREDSDDSDDLTEHQKLGAKFVRLLDVGDRVALIARARYPGWANHIRSATIDVYFSV
ncbi:hypothetical protein CYLTODRAFT_431794 [Cylindrobasidium torrendii FP15055 ss-10]|uniref:Uncharacterized protein n=1 Tax=Cylindrobasidium torrendii FP15055 ss-10 TaxID=1314674 RepID=A0A0D7B8C2_9AGAR|nr:hypothetical protein CYLTODRAFT_431794 [Cylindrobasidium torrendii FP15055 ss-10]